MAAQTRMNYENLSELVFDKDVGKGIIYKETKSIDKEWKEKKVLEFNTFEIKFHSFISVLRSLAMLLIVDEGATRDFYDKYRFVLDEETGKPYIDSKTGKKISFLSKKTDYYFVPEYSKGWMIGRIQSNGKILTYTKPIQTGIRDLFEIESLNVNKILSFTIKQKKANCFSIANKVADKLIQLGLYFESESDIDSKQSKVKISNNSIKQKIDTLLNSHLRCMVLLQNQINELNQRILSEPEKRETFEYEIKIKKRQLMNYEGIERPLLNKMRKLAADYAVKMPLSMRDAEFHDGYIMYIFPYDRLSHGYIDEFGQEVDFVFAKGKNITIECPVSAWILNDYKEDIMSRYGKENLWLWQ